MNFDQFVANFQNPEEMARCGEHRVETQVGDVVLAGTMLTATNEFCCVDINGAQYEIASSDVIDIQVISPTDSAKGTDDSGATADVSAKKVPQVVLIKMKGNTVMSRRIPVQAALVAAMGTWMQVVLPAAKAA